MSSYDVLLVGGGHNGLVAAAQLARAGLKTLVLERRATIGGAAVTDEFHPGFRCSTLAHVAQPARSVIDALHLASHGLELIDPDPWMFAPARDGRALVLSRDESRSAESIAQFSHNDAQAYREFRNTLGRITAVVRDAMAASPPEIDQPSRASVWPLLRLAQKLRGLGKKDAYRLMRWGPMPAADFASEWFESEPLRAVVAAPGIFGTAFGPRSAGSTAVLLMHMASSDGAGAPRLVRGGLGALTAAMAKAAQAAHAGIRVNAGVQRITVANGRVTGVTLASGEELQANVVVSNADPRRTLLGMIDPVELEPSFLARMRAYRSAGNVFKLNLALSGLPSFAGLPASGSGRLLSGRIHIGPDLDYLERAFDASKYGACSGQPYLDITIPSVSDPDMAPAGGHVMSICAQFAPLKLRDGDWSSAGAAFADTIVETLAHYAPNIKKLIVHRQIITPKDLEASYALTGGHIFHGELALDQVFTMRPLLGWARYRTPIAGLYLCGSGTHPGYGVTGLSGLNASREILRDIGK